MAPVKLYPRPEPTAPPESSLGLPQLLQTPSGLALLELQGTVNLPSEATSVEMGKLEFPDGADAESWMKPVHLYVGQHQRLTGEVKKLPKALAVVRRRDDGAGQQQAADLEVVDIVKYKLVFSNRPEPVGTANAP
ncbi:hypothetical protein XA68_10283 [Ophiocordyceps unilateralis]|uniref:Chromosome transmission fidelity protein 8 n=1 Tax=Ophiocordyceps unilateralis TaxID=268505 RepID=A0A2A9PIT3_OPHUN|nr:hypothetical protein XA68_10283 [Ophiocordyceps unilateralis]